MGQSIPGKPLYRLMYDIDNKFRNVCFLRNKYLSKNCAGDGKIFKNFVMVKTVEFFKLDFIQSEIR